MQILTVDYSVQDKFLFTLCQTFLAGIYDFYGHLTSFFSLAMIWWPHPLIQSIHIFEVRKKLPKQVIEKKKHVISVFLFFFIITNEPSPKRSPLPFLIVVKKKALDWKGKYPCPRKTKKTVSIAPPPLDPQRTSPLPPVPQKTNMIPIADCCVWKGLEIKTDLCQVWHSEFSSAYMYHSRFNSLELVMIELCM